MSENSRGQPRRSWWAPHTTPATPYVWAKRLTAELGNARLLTMRGDGHTASFGNNSPCIDAAVQAYLEETRLPRRHTVCSQDVPFAVQPLTAAGIAPGLPDEARDERAHPREVAPLRLATTR